MPAQIKYDRSGHPYYDYGFAGAADQFTQSFMQGLKMGQELKDKEEARRQQRRIEREAYDRLPPEMQQEKIKKMTAQDLVDLGLVVRKGDIIPQGPVQDDEIPLGSEKTYTTGKGPFKKEWTLRPDAVRNETLEEKAKKAQNQAIVNNAVEGSELDILLKKQQYQVMTQQLKAGEFNLKKDMEDDATRKLYLASGDPILMSIATGRPAAEFHEDILRKKYPELADQQDQIKFNIGPHAKAMGEATFQDQAREKFVNPQDRKAWSDAMTAAMYDGDYTKMRNLRPDMKTFGMAQLSIKYEELALNKQQALDTQHNFIQSQAQQLVGMSGGALNMDTATQWVMKHKYGEAVAPMSKEATAQVTKWSDALEGSRQAAATTAFYELQMKRGKAAQEARQGLRENIGTLLAMHKEKLGGKPLEYQMLAIKDELVKQQAAELGLDLTGSSGNFWTEAIWSAAKTGMGVAQLGGSAAADVATQKTSYVGSIAKDIMGPTVLNAVQQYGNNAQSIAAKVGKQLVDSAGSLTDPSVVDWTLEGNDLGKAIGNAMKASPGLRIMYAENVKAYQNNLMVEIEASTDALVKADKLKKLEELNKVLKGMEVQ
jgi:hypothetical protein